MWQQRARAVGLRQVTIARILGRSPWYVSLGIRGQTRGNILAVIVAWELMLPAQRADWLRALGIPRGRQKLVSPVKNTTGLNRCAPVPPRSAAMVAGPTPGCLDFPPARAAFPPSSPRP